MNIFMISLVILPIVIAVGLIMALMVLRNKVGYRVFFPTGIIVVSASVVLMVTSNPIFHIPLLHLGLIYLIFGLVSSGNWEKKNEKTKWIHHDQNFGFGSFCYGCFTDLCFLRNQEDTEMIWKTYWKSKN